MSFFCTSIFRQNGQNPPKEDGVPLQASRLFFVHRDLRHEVKAYYSGDQNLRCR
jgi:hypothetical protein